MSRLDPSEIQSLFESGELFRLATGNIDPTDGGHGEWTGLRTSTGTPYASVDGRYLGAVQIAFALRARRVSSGQVTRLCGVLHCVSPFHLVDGIDRQTGGYRALKLKSYRPDNVRRSGHYLDADLSQGVPEGVYAGIAART